MNDTDMDPQLRGILEQIVDESIRAVPSSVDKFAAVEDLVESPEALTQYGKVWMYGVLYGAYVSMKANEDGDLSTEEMQKIPDIVEQREHQIAEELIR
jgi:hypothetical protein